MRFCDLLKIMNFLPVSFFNDFILKINDEEIKDINIDFKNGFINFK